MAVISGYERDEIVTSIDAKKLSGLLDTTVGYLLGSFQNHSVLRM